MTLTPLTLAALASAGVPGLFPVAADPFDEENPDYVSAVVVDSARQRWLVRSPRTVQAGVRLESEHVILHSFSPSLRARMPFQLPTVVGSADRGGLRSFVYPQIPGQVVELEELIRRSRVVDPERPSVGTQLGRAIATIHALPEDLIREGNLPVYDAEQCRQRMLSDLDRAAGTGRVPAPLLRRWERLLEDPTLWRFRTTVVHGDLSEDSLIFEGGRLSGIRGWHDLQVADPAMDFAWLMSCPEQEFADRIVEVYTVELPHAPDEHLLTRAYLHAEFALATWLVRAVDREDEPTVREAGEMLRVLEQDLAESGALDHAPGS